MRAGRLALLVVVLSMLLASHAYADTLQSPHYKLSESTLGSGGLLQSSSPSYQLGLSVGDAAVGNSSSSNYQIEAGPKTTPDPALTFIVNDGNANFGAFSPSSTATATSTFSVLDYTSYGYIVMIMGNTPTNGPHIIPAMATTAAPQTGVDQFGINLVANTSPTAFGAGPVQKPDNTFSSGTVASSSCSKITAGYDTPNQFRYVNGDTIAASCKSSGETDYTISYIVDVAALTPGGQYSGSQELICIATY